MIHEDKMINVSLKPRGHLMTWLKIAAALFVVNLATPSLAAQAYLKVANSPTGTSQSLELEANKSMLVDLPTNAGEVIVGQPGIATVVFQERVEKLLPGRRMHTRGLRQHAVQIEQDCVVIARRQRDGLGGAAHASAKGLNHWRR